MYHFQGIFINKMYGRQATIKPINSNFTLYVHAMVDKSCPMQFGI